MDDIVKQAMAKWPNVPACSGWLGLDARGQWWLRDEQAQACGAFASGQPGARGSLLRHEKLAEFIGRNYLAESDGRWYFQNGPQRVYVELESAPWIWRLRYAEHGLQLHSHTGQELAAEQVQQVLLDDFRQGLVHRDRSGLLDIQTLDQVQTHRAAQDLAQGPQRQGKQAAVQLRVELARGDHADAAALHGGRTLGVAQRQLAESVRFVGQLGL